MNKKRTIILEVKIKYRDDTQKIFQCWDTPGVGDKWLTLFPTESHLKRLLIPNEAIAEISWDYRFCVLKT